MVPVPFFVRPKVEPVILPPMVKLPALTVTVREAFIVTLPVPMFRSLVPVKVKSPFQFCVLLAVRVRFAPLVLSSVPPVMVKIQVLVPRAWAALIANVPLFIVKLPVMLELPLTTRVPAPFLIVLFPLVFIKPGIVVVPLLTIKFP